MSITAFELFFPGGTVEQYEQVIEKMGFVHHGTGAPGGLFHWVTVTDEGIKVVDVWESPEVFQAFADSQIGPYTQEVGLPEPQITTYPVHNYLTAP
ncbi:MAG TPA: hypothetical protein VF545_12855 [Thermoleophilaceae bacterium]|jgi:hypothetical protein